MSAPVEGEGKPVEPVAPVGGGSAFIPTETALPEYKKEGAPKPTEYEPAAPTHAVVGVEETPITALQPAKKEAKTEDKPTETTETKDDTKAFKTGLLSKWFAATKDKVVKEVKAKSPKSHKKQQEKKRTRRRRRRARRERRRRRRRRKRKRNGLLLPRRRLSPLTLVRRPLPLLLPGR